MLYFRWNCLWIALLAAGCASAKFKVIDAETDTPLAGVRVRQFQYRYDAVIGSSQRSTVLPASDADGLVKAPYDPREAQSFSFEKKGYASASAIKPLKQDAFDISSPLNAATLRSPRVAASEGTIEIPMHAQAAGRTLRFKIEDTNSAEPVPGVQVTVAHGSSAAVPLPATAADGIASASGVEEDVPHVFIFKKPGYQDARATLPAHWTKVQVVTPANGKPSPAEDSDAGDLILVPFFPAGTAPPESTD